MKVIFSLSDTEAKLEAKHDVVAVLPLLFNKTAVDERLKLLGFRRHTSWKRVRIGRYMALLRRVK